MAIDAALGRLGIRPGVCTSSTRPANPFEGQVIYETDTNRTLVYDNAAWLVVADNQVLSIDTTNSRVGINDTSPSYALDVTGDINATGDLRVGGAPVGEWINYAPSQTFGAGLTVGNGTIASAYARVKDVVFMRGFFVLGSTSAVTGNIDMSVPFPQVAAIIQEWPGHVRFWDQDVNVFYGGTPTSLSSSVYRLSYMRVQTVGVFDLIRNGDCSGSAPFGWATGDAFFWSFSYQAA